MKIRRQCHIVTAILYCLFSFCFDFAGTAAEPSEQNPLWRKAVEIASKNHWIPGRIVTHEVTISTEGELLEQTETELQLLPKVQGMVEWKVIKYLKNGIEHTKEAKLRVEGENSFEETREFLEMEDPASLSQQGEFLIHRLELGKIIEGKVCIAYQYCLTRDEERIGGIIWLEKESGAPYEIHSDLYSVPFEENGVTVLSFHQNDRYSYVSRHGWYLRKTVFDVEFDTKSSGQDISGQVRTVCTYSQHWNEEFFRHKKVDGN